MKILVTNDDGIYSDALWALVKELTDIAQVLVVAPDREQSAIGTAVTLRQVLRVKKIEPLVPEVETYSVEGTPSDSVILALGKLVKGELDMVISGINLGLNLGEDVHISGTVGAALQGYLRGFPSLAISADCRNGQHVETAARLAALLVRKIVDNSPPPNIFLNVNVPDLPAEEVAGIQITHLASGSHINTVEEGNDGRQEYYWLVRQRTDHALHEASDIRAIEQGNISITPLHYERTGKPQKHILDNLCAGLLHELKSNSRTA